MSFYLLLFGLLTASAATLVVAATEYCSFTPQHTLCKFQGLGPRCGNSVRSHTVSSTEKKSIVDEHNRLRALVAQGQEKRGQNGAQPPAANMRQLVWDEELARIAQVHAEQCLFEHDCGDCRRVERFGVGQNLFTSSNTRLSENDSAEWKRAINAWYDEVALFNSRKIKPFVFGSAIGHYTQMLWAETSHIGCGYIMFEDKPWWRKMYTCNYGPSGNFIKGEMYRVGNSCSQCPSDFTCSREFPGLCEKKGTSFERFNGSTMNPVPSTEVSTTPKSVMTAAGVTGAPEKTILSCNLDTTGCRVKYFGTLWKVIDSTSTQGRFLGTAVGPATTTSLTMDTVLEPAADGRVCVHFSYLKFSLRGNAVTNVELKLVQVDSGKTLARFVASEDARHEMIGRAVQLLGVQQSYRVVFSLTTPKQPADMVTALAIDDIAVQNGGC